MKNKVQGYSKLIIAGMLIICTGIFSPALAQQQQNANAYTFWDFGPASDDVQNVEQKIWVAMPAPASQWVMTWAWVADPAHGGYLGFNTDAEGKGQALFLYGMPAGQPAECVEFGGEGVGWSCRTPFDIKPDAVYQLRLSLTKSGADGAWWGAWIYEGPDSGAPKEFFLGEIKVTAEMNMIRGNSINNFSEYYGQTQEKCGTVPLSIFGVAPPAANKDENGNFKHPSKFNGSSNPQQNPCKTGDEPQGSLFKVENYAFGTAKGALIFLGGTYSNHTLPENIKQPAGAGDSN